MIQKDLHLVPTEELEISLRLMLVELCKRRISKVYNYVAMTVNNQDLDEYDGTPTSLKLIGFAYENYGLELAKDVYRFFAPARLNPETTINALAEKNGWKIKEVS
jgi:hypothetical protein